VNLLKWFKREPEPVIIRDEVLEKVVKLLFPQPVEKTGPEGTYVIDYSVDSNLMSALADLELGTNDRVVHETFRSCLAKLYEARDMLYADDRVTDAATYLVIEQPQLQNTPDTIKVGGG
jgi:hypothetical protein